MVPSPTGMRMSPASRPAASVRTTVWPWIGWTAAANPLGGELMDNDFRGPRAIIGLEIHHEKRRHSAPFVRNPRPWLFAVELLLHLAAFLRLDREGRRGAREQALDADRFARLLAV